MTAESLPCALAIGGLDPGGGAGLAADLRAFAAAGVFGCAVAAVLTVQSVEGLRRVVPVASRLVLAQGREVVRNQRVGAIKVGALGTAENVRAVSRLLAEADVPAVVDTPMLPSRGTGRLLAERALRAMRSELLPRATVLTVNAVEAEALSGVRVATLSEAHDAALALARTGARVVLVKGGHLDALRDRATDVLATGGRVAELRARPLAIPLIRGTGCTLASLIAGRIARRGFSLDAIRWGKRKHHAALAHAARIGGTARVLAFM
jgi:hydroxymethylpyrimidine/phosphomethylpyrimidine kinase